MATICKPFDRILKFRVQTKFGLALGVLGAVCFSAAGHAATLETPEPARGMNGGTFNHQCAVMNDAIYVISHGGHTAFVEVDANGDLGPWKYSSYLFPEGMGENYFCATAFGDGLYAAGGYYHDKETGQDAPSASVVFARVQPDGSVDPWEKTSPLPEPRAAGALVAMKGFLYYVGGLNQRRVFFAPILKDGKIGQWKETRRLMSNRHGMQVFGCDDYLYVVGGWVMHERAVETVFRARIGPDGALEKWTRTEPLPEPRAGYAGVIVNRDVFLFGGTHGEQTKPINSAVGATIGSDGHFSDWRDLTPLPMEAIGLQAVRVQQWIYVIGGITLQEPENKLWDTVWRYHLKP